jgi:hypothetical protein
MFGARSPSVSSSRPSDELLVVRRARMALQLVIGEPECSIVAAEQLQQAARLLREAQSALDRNDPLDTVLYLSRLSERHAQEGAELILRCRSERHFFAGWARRGSGPGDDSSLAIG